MEKEKAVLDDATKKEEIWSKKRDEHKKLATDGNVRVPIVVSHFFLRVERRFLIWSLRVQEVDSWASRF